jgi:hypothetical protein
MDKLASALKMKVDKTHKDLNSPSNRSNTAENMFKPSADAKPQASPNAADVEARLNDMFVKKSDLEQEKLAQAENQPL